MKMITAQPIETVSLEDTEDGVFYKYPKDKGFYMFYEDFCIYIHEEVTIPEVFVTKSIFNNEDRFTVCPPGTKIVLEQE